MEETKQAHFNEAASAKESGLSRVYDTAARPYIDLIDELRTMGIERDIAIPQIAVMGDQSSGKSSVLESLCGIPFPRGSGLVTRCATQIRMKRAARGSEWFGRVALSWDKPQPSGSGIIADSSTIGQLIEDMTQQLLSDSGSDFSTESIVIDICSPDVPDLTVVDLPGIIRTTTKGQEKRVIKEVNDLINTYLEQPRTIILAVIPANVDIATVDILEKAAAVDPDGNRTLGVFTKPDLVDAGSEAEIVSVLLNQKKPLTHGYNMLRNRNQQQLAKYISIDEAHELEMEYFEQHPIYSTLPSEIFGITHLTDKLTNLLVRRIIDQLPTMKAELTQLIHNTTDELLNMGNPPPIDMGHKFTEYHRLVTDFSDLFREAIDGKYRDQAFNHDKSLRLCAYAQNRFSKMLQDLLLTRPPFGEDEFIQSLLVEQIESRGRELPGFLSTSLFNKLMSDYIMLWRHPALACLSDIEEECLRVCEVVVRLKLAHYPVIAAHALSCISEHIVDAARLSGAEIANAVIREIDEPYTQNHYFMDTVNKLRSERFLASLECELNGFADPTTKRVSMEASALSGTEDYWRY